MRQVDSEYAVGTPKTCMLILSTELAYLVLFPKGMVLTCHLINIALLGEQLPIRGYTFFLDSTTCCLTKSAYRGIWTIIYF